MLTALFLERERERFVSEPWNALTLRARALLPARGLSSLLVKEKENEQMREEKQGDWQIAGAAAIGGHNARKVCGRQGLVRNRAPSFACLAIVLRIL